jgi:hypothetical protein
MLCLGQLDNWIILIIYTVLMMAVTKIVLAVGIILKFKQVRREWVQKFQISFPETGKAHKRPRTPHLCMRQGKLM